MTLIESFSAGTPVLCLDFGNGGDITCRIYGRRNALMRNISELPQRIMSFDKDLSEGLYDYEQSSLSLFTPEKNYEMLMEIYEKCLTSW